LNDSEGTVKGINVGIVQIPYDVYGINVGVLAAGTEDDSRGSMTGVNIGGVITVVHKMTGVNVGGVVGYTNHLKGVGGGLISVSSHAKGISIGGLANFALDELQGIQAAGIANLGEDIRGLQISGFVNYVSPRGGSEKGCARSEGAQIAAGINYSTDHTGVQIGLLNIVGRSRGGCAQFGLFNWSSQNHPWYKKLWPLFNWTSGVGEAETEKPE
jgi:hypothetical protein